MPITTTQILSDAIRKTRIRLSTRFVTGDGDEQNVIKVQPATLIGALNTAGHILSGNANARPFYNTTIRNLTWNAPTGAGKTVSLLWQSNTGAAYGNTVISHLTGTGSYPASRGPDITFSTYGPNASNIMISTTGFVANDAYSIEFDLIKSPAQFDWGEIDNPQEFNFPPRKVFP
jgi:hypothetical protein